MSAIDIDLLRTWIGRSERRSEPLTAAPVTQLAAMLDAVDPAAVNGSPLFPLSHWLYFLPVVRLSQVGEDGHPLRGGFLPPVPLPRRMWAAGAVNFPGSLVVGEIATRSSTIVDVSLKAGRGGTLVFVKLRHTLADSAGRVAIDEEQDLVYRDPPAPGATVVNPAPTPAPAGQTWLREIRPDPLLLFRYSALTFNGHRIHYDRPYATQVENYPALVVHGPLVATLLVDHLLRALPSAKLRRFEFRAIRPLFDDAPFFLCGEPEPDGRSFRLWSRDATGALCTDARAFID